MSSNAKTGGPSSAVGLTSVCPRRSEGLLSLHTRSTQSSANMRATLFRRAGFMFRENRVPHYQRLFQKNDGVRQWHKTPLSPYILFGFYTIQWVSFSGAMYMMCRLVMGKKTWWD